MGDIKTKNFSSLDKLNKFVKENSAKVINVQSVTVSVNTGLPPT